MFFSTIISFAGFLAIGTEARYFKRSDGITISSKKPVSQRSPSEIVSTSTYLPLAKTSSKGTQRSLRSLAVSNGNTTSLNSLETGEEFAAPVTIGGQNFTLTIDTGSSDTWVVERGLRCYDIETERLTSESECAFRPSYTKSSTFTPYLGRNLLSNMVMVKF
jgi:aspergillopepsin I